MKSQEQEIRCIEFTQQEAQAAIDMLQIATQARGLEVAEAAVHLRNKLFSAFQDQQTEDVETTKAASKGKKKVVTEPKTDQ
jgi:predicted DNA-binding transcriptional regulator YafY